METCSFFTFYRFRKQLSDRFQGKGASAFNTVKIIPKNFGQCKAEDEALVLEYYNENNSSPSTFQQELKLWKRYWATENDKPKSLSQTVSPISEKQIEKMFPNVMRVFEMLLVIPACASVERSNSALSYIKNLYRNSMSEPRVHQQLSSCSFKKIVTKNSPDKT